MMKYLIPLIIAGGMIVSISYKGPVNTRYDQTDAGGGPGNAVTSGGPEALLGMENTGGAGTSNAADVYTDDSADRKPRRVYYVYNDVPYYYDGWAYYYYVNRQPCYVTDLPAGGRYVAEPKSYLVQETTASSVPPGGPAAAAAAEAAAAEYSGSASAVTTTGGAGYSSPEGSVLNIRIPTTKLEPARRPVAAQEQTTQQGSVQGAVRRTGQSAQAVAQRQAIPSQLPQRPPAAGLPQRSTSLNGAQPIKYQTGPY